MTSYRIIKEDLIGYTVQKWYGFEWVYETACLTKWSSKRYIRKQHNKNNPKVIFEEPHE